MNDQTTLIEAAAEIKSAELRFSLIDLLVLMAVCDGELAEKERELLAIMAERLEVSLELSDIKGRAGD